jgi:hypothetical protein
MAECLYKPPLSSFEEFFLQTSVVGPRLPNWCDAIGRQQCGVHQTCCQLSRNGSA